MPVATRPPAIALLLLATAVPVAGCIFPFTRNSDAASPDMLGVASADAPAGMAPTTPAATSSKATAKPLPPFARFLGGLIRQEDAAPAEGEAPAAPAPVESSPAAQPMAPVVRVVDSSNRNGAPHETPVPLISAATLLAGEEKSQAALPPVSRVSPPPTTTAIARPDTSPEPQETPPPARQAALNVSNSAAETETADVSKEALGPHLKAPWESLPRLPIHREEPAQTLSQSLTLALEKVRAERDAQSQPAVRFAESSSTEATSTLPSVSQPSTIVETPPKYAASGEIESGSSPSVVVDAEANPLREGSTDWTGRRSLRHATPQTIVNSTVEGNPTNSMTVNSTNVDSTQVKSVPATAPRESRFSFSPASSLPEEDAVVSSVPSSKRVEPQTTVNPYTDRRPDTQVAQQAPDSPLVVSNPLIPLPGSAPQRTTATPISTEAIHFGASLVTMLQAANEHAQWDFSNPGPVKHQPQSAPQAPDATTATEEPEAEPVEPRTATLALPQAPSPQAALPQTVRDRLPAAEPKTVINSWTAADQPTASPPDSAAPSQPETRGATVRRAQIRPAMPSGMVEPAAEAPGQPPAPVEVPPRVAPVIRAVPEPEYVEPVRRRPAAKVYDIRLQGAE